MPIAQTNATQVPQGTLEARSHKIAIIDLGGRTHTMETSASLLVMDPALAVQCEVAKLDYVWVNPAQVAVLIVEGIPQATAPLLLGPPAETSELLAEQLNGASADVRDTGPASRSTEQSG